MIFKRFLSFLHLFEISVQSYASQAYIQYSHLKFHKIPLSWFLSLAFKYLINTLNNLCNVVDKTLCVMEIT